MCLSQVCIKLAEPITKNGALHPSAGIPVVMDWQVAVLDVVHTARVLVLMNKSRHKLRCACCITGKHNSDTVFKFLSFWNCMASQSF